jgi:hypothetical protein
VRANCAPVVTLAQRFRAVPSGTDLAWFCGLRLAMRALTGFRS